MIFSLILCWYLTEFIKIPVLYQSYIKNNIKKYKPFFVNERTLKQYKVEKYYQRFSIYIRVGKINETIKKLNNHANKT